MLERNFVPSNGDQRMRSPPRVTVAAARSTSVGRPGSLRG
jgi:hypothetical protein